jgi:hypothetical protein
MYPEDAIGLLKPPVPAGSPSLALTDGAQERNECRLGVVTVEEKTVDVSL